VVEPVVEPLFEPEPEAVVVEPVVGAANEPFASAAD
jgi:hypothetical protein